MPHLIGDKALRPSKEYDDQMSENRRYAPGEMAKLQDKRLESSRMEGHVSDGKKNTHTLLRKYRPVDDHIDSVNPDETNYDVNDRTKK